jgi:predicted ester cyclase
LTGAFICPTLFVIVELYRIGHILTEHPPSTVTGKPTTVAARSIHAMAHGDRAEFDVLYHPKAVDRENVIQPPSSRVPGPAGFYATALWLRAAYADLHYDIHHAIAQGDLVAVNSTMKGRHCAPFVMYTGDGHVDTVFPPTNKSFAMTQTHWLRFKDGRIVEHWANRDDLGTARQLGWIPPTPTYLLKMALAKRQAKSS